MRFLRFLLKFRHALSHCQCSKICPKLPKSIQRQLIQETLKFQKLRFWYFSKKKLTCVEGDPKHVQTVWIFIPSISPKPILLSKKGLCIWISTYPFVQNDVFLKVSHVLCVWDFVDMYLTNIKIRIWSPLIHIYSQKWCFWPPKHCCSPWA